MPRCKAFSNTDKLHILDRINELLQSAEENSFRACCRAVGIQPCQARRWQALRDKLDRFEAINRSSLHQGRPSILEPLQEPLLQWFFELREQGFMVSVRLITLKACELSGEFRRKGARAKDMTVRRFLARHRIVLRAVTHECQQPPEALRQEAKDFISFAKSKLAGANRCQRYILNMDQTPIFLTCHQVELSTLQEQAWMDERVMKMWIRLVLKPYVETAPAEIQPVILLDSYRCHLMATVVSNDIEDIGVEIIHIPGGCTGLCQPVDIGIGKPLKSRARQLWESWMIDNGVDNDAVSRPPSRIMLTEWITESVEGIRQSSTIVKNSWRHTDYSYFPRIEEEEGTWNEQRGAHKEQANVED